MSDVGLVDSETCWKCGGEGFSHHDCGEDCCCCADPINNVTCDICDGEGYLRKETPMSDAQDGKTFTMPKREQDIVAELKNIHRAFSRHAVTNICDRAAARITEDAKELGRFKAVFGPDTTVEMLEEGLEARAKVARLRTAIENAMKHLTIVGGDLAKRGTTYRILSEALEE